MAHAINYSIALETGDLQLLKESKEELIKYYERREKQRNIKDSFTRKKNEKAEKRNTYHRHRPGFAHGAGAGPHRRVRGWRAVQNCL